MLTTVIGYSLLKLTDQWPVYSLAKSLQKCWVRLIWKYWLCTAGDISSELQIGALSYLLLSGGDEFRADLFSSLWFSLSWPLFVCQAGFHLCRKKPYTCLAFDAISRQILSLDMEVTSLMFAVVLKNHHVGLTHLPRVLTLTCFFFLV